jgi:hypothetical protein
MKSLGLGLVAGLSLAASAGAQHSVWLPGADHLVVTPSYVYQNFDEFWMGATKVDAGGDTWQHTAFLGFDYGITENMAFDAQVGWVWSETDAAMLGASSDNHLDDDGLTDTTFGLRERFVDETTLGLWWVPSLALRIGGIIPGTYDENFPFSAGDGAYGAEVSLLGGKTICPGFGLYGDVGYRYREGRVPDEWFGSAGLFLAWKFLAATAGYRFFEGLSGNDIGDTGFKFNTVKEVSQNLEASIGVRDPGGRYYQLFYAHTIDGRNTGQRDIFGGAVSFTF